MKTVDERTTYAAVGFSDKGKVRADNQDDYLILNKDGVCLAVVADGIGGLTGGAEASRFLIQGLADWWRNNETHFLRHDKPLVEIEEALVDCIDGLNESLLLKSDKSGSTLSLLLLYQDQYLIKHAGDSRIYFMRDFGLEQLTHDHTWYEREKLRQPDHSSDATKMRNVLVNAIGVKADYFLETAKGDLRNVRLALLCTDGVYKYFVDNSISWLLQENTAVEAKAACLEEFLQCSPAADNYTAIIIQKEKFGYVVGD